MPSRGFENALLEARLAAALDRRRALASDPGIDAYRLIHAEADGLPGITLDRFADVGVLSLYRPFSEPEEAALVSVLERVLGPNANGGGTHPHLSALYLKRRPRSARDSQRDLEQLAPSRPVWGEPRESVIAREGGLRFLIRPGEGLAVGLYLDMREIRAWIRSRARGASVLNCFAYTCAFSVAGLAGGARRVVNVDLSRRVLDWGEQNAALNGQTVDRRDYLSGDVFEWLARLAKKGDHFEVVILDPPAFATSRRGRKHFSVERDYAALAEAATRVCAPSGLLLACCNRVSLPKGRLRVQVDEGVKSAGRGIRGVERLGASRVDFPTAPGEAPTLEVLAVTLD